VGVTRSPFATVFAIWQTLRLRRRVAIDEQRLSRLFGDDYRSYVAQVPRWL
jgi:protein-S-isoprenylcysteine O-methyltransferase Ste14